MNSTYEEVALWNKRCGKSPEPVGTIAYWKAIKDQRDRITEELRELNEAIEAKDIQEVVDAGCDLDVVVSGLNYLSGADYSGALGAILENNDLKYTRVKSNAELQALVYDEAGLDVYVNEADYCNGWDKAYCIRRVSDGKVMKFAGHPKVDLAPFVPEPVMESVLIVKDFDSQRATIEAQTKVLHNLRVVTLEGLDDPSDIFAEIIGENPAVMLYITNGEAIGFEVLEEGE